MKKLLSAILICLMLISCVPSTSLALTPNNTTNYVVQTTKVRLNITKKTLYIGKLVQLKMIGTKKKVSWSSSNKKIAIVSKNGKVKALREGKANIWAKVGNKKYRCLITVVKPVSSKYIVAKYHNLGKGKGVVGVLKNNNSFPVHVELNVFYYYNGNLIGLKSDENYCLEKGKICALNADGPYNSNYDDLSYTSYKVKLKVEKCSSITPLSSKIKIVSKNTGNNIISAVKNKSNKNLDFVVLSVLFFDKNGKCIGYDRQYAECEIPGTVDYLTFDYPYNSNYDTIIPARYVVYLNTAYCYNW